MTWRETNPAPAGAVTPVELFFDIVFVFTLTQITRVLEADLTITGVGKVLLLFGTLWWMYGGYAWLTNHVPPRRPIQKLLLFLGMVGFFIAALGIPHAFDRTGVVFGAGYLVVIVVHLVFFTQSDATEGVARLAPFNLGAALLILAAGFLDGRTVYLTWTGAFALMAIVPYFVPRYSWVGVARSFHVATGHFVERHGLLLIIALGESVIAIGMAADTEHLSAGILGIVILALTLPATFWWTYFTDVPSAERRLASLDQATRSLFATRVYFFAHIPILLGIVIAAAGVHSAIAHPTEPAPFQAACALAGGVALFLAGIAEVRRSLTLGSPLSRVVAALLVLATIPVGLSSSAALHLACVVGIIGTMLLLDPRKPPSSLDQH
jgi:low temperature requirement protein LtrA